MEGEGIVAEWQEWVPVNPQTREDRELLGDAVLEHLDWRSGNPSPFISTSTDREWVLNEARRRADDEHPNVRVYEISITDDRLNEYEGRNGRVNWRKVMGWLDRANERMPWYADFPSTRNECLFLHHIPEEFLREMDW